MVLKNYASFLCIALGLLLNAAATADTYTDNFSGATATLNWKALNYACLTAGSGSGSIPACSGIKDTSGAGALRLTPASTQQTGAILSNFTFPSGQGLQVTFTTYTYGGDSGGTAKDGADGITFFLTDGTQDVPASAGGSGGSLGYSCSNQSAQSQYEGVANGYLGLGIDEFGNYLNKADNTSTGWDNTYYSGDTTYGSNGYYSSDRQYQPERIGLRGAGNLTWAWLKSQNSSYYSGSVNAAKVKTACHSGQYVSGSTRHGNTTTYSYTTIPYNYNAIPGGYAVLPGTQQIAKESAKVRTSATPITYKLQISTSGLLNFSYSYNNGTFQPVLVNSSISASNGPVPASFRFGFSAGTGTDYNIHEITCFQAAPLQSNSSAAANTVQSGEVETDTQIYLATYSSDNWWGSVAAYGLTTNTSGLSVASTSNWDAKCVLTGGDCTTMGTDSTGKTKSITVLKPEDRTLLTYDGISKGLPLEWASLTHDQQTNLDSTDDAGEKRLNWLRGDRSNEQLVSSSGTLRNRTGVLGDILDSGPTWVGAPVGGNYPDAFIDMRYGTTVKPQENASTAQLYSTFVSSNATRQNVVYVGSNDGLLHGFRAGAYSSAGVYDSSTNDGHEVLGYMPAGIIGGANIVGLTNPNYGHSYFVDASPVASDLFYGGKWHTWLVGGLGTGGNEIYALDVTTPANFTEDNASTLVVGDWTTSTATLSKLGNTVGTPIIQRMHNGQWAIIFGNGLNGSGDAGIYIGLVDATSGAVTVTFKFLDTGYASAGISSVASADLDGDQICDYLYAGDTRGNVWRFDVTSNDASKWASSTFGNTSATPLYVALDASGNRQPITTAAVVASVKTGGAVHDMVYFGTGQKTPATSINGDVYATGTQTFYGIWDWDMGAWNKLASSSSQYATLTGPRTATRNYLLSQSVLSTSTGGTNAQVLGYRNLSTTGTVCWQGTTTCSANNNQFGWYFDLPSTQEQIIYNPEIIDGAVVVSTAIPPTVSAIQCNPGQQTGWTMAFDPASGGGLSQGFFPNTGGTFGSSGGSAVGGIQLNGVGSVAAVTYKGQTYLLTQTTSGSAALSQVNPSSAETPSRISWHEIRN